ncbi:MAG: hypothetical protein ACRDKT_13140 [Actinomycetota bacterium]
MAVVRTALAAVVFVALSVAPAAAHDERSLHRLTVLDRVTGSIDGLEIRVVHMGMPALAVRNRSGRNLTVLGERGEPFLRIGPRGVFANIASPTTYRSIDPENDLVPPGIRNDRGWAKFSESPEWSWFDPRLASKPDATAWAVDMRFGAEPVRVEGGFESLHGHGHFITDADPPEIAGLDLRMIQGPIPAVFVRNDTGETLHVAGREGEPFLRIGPDGVVANVMSPSYHAGGSQRIAPVPRWADPSADPRWKRVSPQPVWGWLDQRAALPAELQQRSLLGPERRIVATWTIPMELGNRPLPLEGTVEWIPPSTLDASDASRTIEPVQVALAALVLAAAIAFVVTGRRRPAAA